MKTRWMIVTMASLGLLGLTGPRANAHLEVSAGFEISAEADFYEPLGSHGAWVEVGSYGRCWRPARVAVDWRPYCDGHWEWTDFGWYWATDEPWGWACYHYGRWVYDPVYFWVWVPGVEWGPAWVTWREGGGYVGWAPLPPAVGFSGGVIVASHVHVEPSLFVFVQTGHFLQPVRPRTVIVNNTTIINKTVNITNIRQENKSIAGGGPRKVVVNEGPRVDAIEKATSKKVEPTPITRVAKLSEPPGPVREKLQNRREQPKAKPQRQAPPSERREEPKVQPRREALPEQKPATPPGIGREKPNGDKVKPHPPTEKPGESEPPKERPNKHHEGEEAGMPEEGSPGHGKEKD